jgi:receptor-interacting serine/threonine-protein kinase 5
MSHENFETLLKQLEHRHSDRLKSTEDKQQRVRKEFTPKIARHLLESTSLKDLIQYGLPKQGREVGRGQYGVVYECESWANQRSCVLKSVIPPDDRHWNDLALEFHYLRLVFYLKIFIIFILFVLRRIPEHPRVVKLIGSVVDYSYRDQTPVLLVMERLTRDLYTALKNKLSFHIR